MQFGYLLLYVPAPPAAVDFYERAFGLTCRFLHEGGDYAELETGGTRLGFVANSLAGSHGFSYAPQTPGGLLPAFEIGFTTPDVPAAYQRALGRRRDQRAGTDHQAVGADGIVRARPERFSRRNLLADGVGPG